MLKLTLLLSIFCYVAADNCPVICPLIYAPVCAQDPDNAVKMYSNNCDLQMAQCRNPTRTLKTVSMDLCTKNNRRKRQASDCPQICPLYYSPVCAQDPDNAVKMYSNNCDLQMAQCRNPTRTLKTVSMDLCTKNNRGKRQASDCPQICPLYYSPVCAQDPDNAVKMYSNNCDLQMAQCRNPTRTLKTVSMDLCTKNNRGKRQASDCPQICPLYYSPVCAQDPDNAVKMYSNNCDLQMAQCRNPTRTLKTVSMDLCTKNNRGKRQASDCPQICPLYYNPVCVQDQDGVFELHPNECMFKTAKCRAPTRTFTTADISSCDRKRKREIPSGCRAACPRNFEKVCGVNKDNVREEFTNRCLFQQKQCLEPESNWQELPGVNACNPLLRTRREVCSKACPDNLDQVCGITSIGVRKTFSNECELEIEQCENRSDGWRIEHRGPCVLRT